MRLAARAVFILTFTVALAPAAYGHANYTGYSGAPGSDGRCASSCHGSSGGTIQVSGFPESYTAGEVYTLTVTHTAGTTIRNFNGSCRVGTGSANAGVIASGTGTVTYNVPFVPRGEGQDPPTFHVTGGIGLFLDRGHAVA